MGTKISIVIGDYTYGGNELISVGQVLKFQKSNFDLDREKTMSVITRNLLNAMKELESDEKLNPVPQDEPCCEHFVDFSQKNDINKMKVCPLCATPITKERHAKFDKTGSEVPF